MRILCWTAGYWQNPDHAQRFEGTWQGYRAWYDRVQRCFKPIGCFIASGSWSDPALSPVPEAVTVNAGVLWDKPFDLVRMNYSCMAVTAAMAHALNRAKDWDFLVLLETDALLGALNLQKLFADFAARPELILSPSWSGVAIGGPLVIWKPEGAIRMLHHHPFSAFADPDEPDLAQLPEYEWLATFRNGELWWNPWPEHLSLRQDWGDAPSFPDDEMINWPLIGRPRTPEFAKRFEENHLANCVTM